MSGTVHTDPLDIMGSAPMTSRKSVRSMSGTGIAAGSPNISPHERCLGIWSTVLAVTRTPGRRAWRNGRVYSCPASVCTLGLPRYSATDSRPWVSSMCPNRSSM
jgi:hypothetical protein